MNSELSLPEEKWFQMVCEMAEKNVSSGKGGPFAALVLRNDQLISAACNEVLQNSDPTAHAEVNAIRQACKVLGDFQLHGCILISSCEPCPMCLGAIYWARPDLVFYLNTRNDAAEIGFDDQFIYDEISKNPPTRKIPFFPIHFPEAKKAFEAWKNKLDKTNY